MGRRECAWQDAPYVLSLFHENQGTARRAYYSFVEKGIAHGKRPDLIGGGLVRSAGGWAAVQDLRKSKEVFASDERILGSSSFVDSVLMHANEDRALIATMQGLDMEKVVAFVCTLLGSSSTALKSPTKQSSVARARALIAHFAFDTLNIRGVDIARQLNVTPSAVSKLAAKGRADPLSEEIGRTLFKER